MKCRRCEDVCEQGWPTFIVVLEQAPEAASTWVAKGGSACDSNYEATFQLPRLI